jgi:hypothetical protein
MDPISLPDLVAQLIHNERTAPRTEALDDEAGALREMIAEEMLRRRLKAA